jgi:hypothetical protein
MPTFSKFERLPAFRNIREDFVKFTGISTLAEATLLLFHEQSESDSSLYKAVLSAFTNLNSSPTARDTFRELTLSLNKVLSLSGFGSEKLPLVVTRGHQITQKSNLTYRSSDSRSISESTELYRTSREDSTIMESTLDYSLTDNTLSQKKNRSIQNYTPTCTPPPEEELSLSNTTYTANREELLKGIAPSPRVLRYLITEIESTTGKKLRSTPSLFQILNSLSLQQTRP